ncbi:MAG: S16 family serine protease [Candidatus Margulisiibacteriota bacterium]|nr:S16 family serine protease [Candidatus Margulisiibacteriota bacterium]
MRCDIKKVISLQPSLQQKSKTDPLYLQLEFLTHWLNNINQNDEQKIDPNILSMTEIIKIITDLESENNDLSKIKKNIYDIKKTLIEHCQNVGFYTIEQITLAEIGLIESQRINEECLTRLIFLNRNTQPIWYEKKRTSARTEMIKPDNNIDELTTEGILYVSPSNMIANGIHIQLKHKNQRIDMHSLFQINQNKKDIPDSILKKIKLQKNHIYNLKSPEIEINQRQPKNKRRKMKDKIITTDFRDAYIEVLPSIKLLTYTQEELNEDLIETYKCWQDVLEKTLPTTIEFELEHEKNVKNKLEKLHKDLEGLISHFKKSISEQPLILNLLVHFEKLKEASILLKYCSKETKKTISKQILNTLNNYLFIERQSTDIEDNCSRQQKFIKTLSLINPKERNWLRQEYKAVVQTDTQAESNYPKRSERFDQILNIPFGKIKGKLKSITMDSPLLDRQEFATELKTSLNKKLHGQNDAKAAIINIIGQIIANPAATPKPILFVGPPGTGKTSLAKEIANVLDKGMGIISLGGEPDKHLLAGSDIVYESANMGEICRILQNTNQMDPIIVLDEIDKLGTGRDGEATQRQIMALTDPLTKDWRDNYLRMNINIDQVWFIMTANDPSLIDPILLDRVQVIYIDMQTKHDQQIITKNHIIPRLLDQFNFPEKSLIFSDDLIKHVISSIPNKPGCRLLEDVFRQIISELNLKRFTHELKPSLHLKPIMNSLFKLPYKVTKTDTAQPLLKYQNHNESIHSTDTIGLINGLYATTDKRGGVLPIQVIASPLLEKDVITGNCGETMKESIAVARTLNLQLTPPANNNDTNKHIHLHVPDMGTQKDGPSAGTAITFAILSALRNQAIKHDIAITGEVDIHGNILAVGGILEKLTGARDAGVSHVILPNKNKFELEYALQKAPHLREELKITLINHIKEAITHIIIE